MSTHTATPAKTTTHSMTEGNILSQIILFSLPLMLGNIFQMLYNTVDSIVVGNFVGTTALAAVGSTTMIINMVVFFFNGFSVGAGVVIGHFFGAKNMKKLHTAIETTMALTFLASIIITILSVLMVEPMLYLMDTPEDVFADAVIYLRIYFAGVSGLLIYNMGSGILRAVGDTTRPLYFLIFTSVMNILLDLLFVLVFRMGIAGVAVATIIAQFISAGLILLLLSQTSDIYKMTWRDLWIDRFIMGQIFSVGFPSALQAVITSVSNVFVQSYINFFGSAAMAGWSCYNKLDTFIMLPLQSTALAGTTFVSQNIGAGQKKRANQGTFVAVLLSVTVTLAISTFLFVFTDPAIRLFTQDTAVVAYGRLFLHLNVFFLVFNCVNHTLAAALRGRGDSKGPMIIMLLCFVAIRQTYLFTVTHYVANTPRLVSFGYPVGWMTCCLVEVIYFLVRLRSENY